MILSFYAPPPKIKTINIPEYVTFLTISFFCLSI